MTIRFYSTYEELKHYFLCLCYYVVFVFTVPMRNWNFFNFFNISKIFRFYSTYEELKPSKSSSSRHLLRCFYSTYEELKQIAWVRTCNGNWKVFTVPMRNWNNTSRGCTIEALKRFYSTYEELKQVQVNRNSVYLDGFYSTYEELKRGYWIYFRSALTMFLQYLWGIETSRYMVEISNIHTSFYSTYEELKRVRSGAFV